MSKATLKRFASGRPSGVRGPLPRTLPALTHCSSRGSRGCAPPYRWFASSFGRQLILLVPRNSATDLTHLTHLTRFDAFGPEISAHRLPRANDRCSSTSPPHAQLPRPRAAPRETAGTPQVPHKISKVSLRLGKAGVVNGSHLTAKWMGT